MCGMVTRNPPKNVSQEKYEPSPYPYHNTYWNPFPGISLGNEAIKKALENAKTSVGMPTTSKDNKQMTLSLSAEALDRLWPHAAHSVVDGITAASGHAFEKYGLTTEAEIIDFLAQISEESAGATELEENLNYSAQAIVRCWPSRWPTLASAMPYAHNPRALADAAYGGRMGNIPGSDDGWKFRGRGLIQITGRTAYASTAQPIGEDLLANPDLLLQPTYALESACIFWKNNNLNALASVGNFRAETIRINGGLNGYAIRHRWRDRIQKAAKELIIQ